MPFNPTARLRFTFTDCEQNTAYTQWYTPYFAPINTVLLAIDTIIAPSLSNVSDATLTSYTITYDYAYPDAPAPGIDSNIKRQALLFFENVDGDINRLKILSPRNSIFEIDGRLKGIRTHQGIRIDLFAILSSLPFINVDGSPFGTEYVTGGLSV